MVAWYGDDVSVFFFQAEDGIRCADVTGVQTCALPIWTEPGRRPNRCHPRRRNYPALDPEESRCDHVNKPTNDKLSKKGAATMKLTTTTNISVDGVMQGLGGADEDRRGGFERGGWAPPLFDDETATFLGEVYQRADAFLFGRRTYEIFAGSWGTWDD